MAKVTLKDLSHSYLKKQEKNSDFVLTNINIDYQTGFIYAPISTRWGNNGVISINQKDLSINYDSQLLFKETIQTSNQYSYVQWHNHLNITTLLLDRGMLILSTNNMAYYKKIAMVNLSGCALGRGVDGTICSPCDIGTFSNEIGGVCNNCHAGYAVNDIESVSCNECEPGKFTNGVHAFNCLNCPNGFYSDNSASSNCKACKNGTYSIIQGSPSRESCLDCPGGKISESGSETCDFCLAGKWAHEKIICEDCPKGKYSFMQYIISVDDCKICERGKYQDEIMQITESKLFSNLFSNKSGMSAKIIFFFFFVYFFMKASLEI